MVNTGGIAGEQLRSFLERIERLEEEKKAIAEDIKEVYAQAKATGFDPKIMRMVIRLRKMDQADRQEQEALLDVYLHATEGAAAYRDNIVAISGDDEPKTYTVQGAEWTYNQLKASGWTDEQIGQLG